MKERFSMKRYLMLASLFLMYPQWAAAEVEPARHAVIEAITCGEIDPNVVGDACLALVQIDNGEAVGLVAPLALLDAYPVDALVAMEGRRVEINDVALQPIDDVEAIDVLSAPGEARRFFWWNGNWSVEN